MATLKISDLSVGDWVYVQFTDGDKLSGRIVSLSDTGSMEVLCPNTKVVRCTIHFIFPIHITAEVLEKNGFEEHCGGIFRYEWMWQGESSGITLCSFDEELWFVDLFFKEGKDIMCNIPTFSVHQLQHILRLAGVEKEIVIPNK
ncbi:MAG: hypothetical protein IKA96_06350 [Alistipes sp.]|nr:hypothetical protein [Alistipes sp.]MBR2628712.1 hypothetical protein [Alistipes sp.]